MLKNEVIDLLQDLEILYPGKFKIESARIVELWHAALKEEEAETIKRNLSRYVKSNAWPPSISDLMEMDTAGSLYVPDYETTQKMLQERDAEAAKLKAGRTEEEKQEIERIQQGIREMLGMGDSNGKH